MKSIKESGLQKVENNEENPEKVDIPLISGPQDFFISRNFNKISIYCIHSLHY